MKAIIVDDERLSVCALQDACEEIPGLEIVSTFLNTNGIKEFITEHDIDLAFLDIEMPGVGGIALAKSLQAVKEDFYVIFVTGFKEYALDAFNVDAIDYILKPFDIGDIKKALRKASKLIKSDDSDDAFIRTFGYFDVFINGTAIDFKSHKAKELLALLVDQRGAVVTMEHAVDTLWPDEKYDERIKAKYRKACMYLRQSLQNEGLDRLVTVSRARLTINCSAVKCDYFSFIESGGTDASGFNGEYMFQYSWAETTLAHLENIMYGQHYNA